ncbi:uncharacterized protein N7459_001252 [Penicillium hispanicum]|uniref:uncharacterized protein n=1 Tax=Penicillium hispanicum TaxID=1080232 RepID=UPI00253F7AF4|nr:uncharacterized protein N7459_001252 [Penicillium hispanicum]KAJ5595044.1 hypothetical protein N7459_001252 [Penicillium hispanicum]
MEVSEDTVHKIQEFVQNRQAVERESDSEPLSATALHAYTRRLDGTLRELQEQFQRQEDELRKLRERHSHGLLEGEDNPWARVSQARRAKEAYDSLLQTDYALPATESVLPPLIAIEETSQLIKDSKVSAVVTAEKLSADRERLRVEEANLHDSRAIANGLRERIQRIRNVNARKREQTPSQVAREVVSQQKQKNKDLDHASVDLKSSLDKFIDKTLAPMLAAEDLGGPTVGDALEVPDATLKAGYTASGKPKKAKQPVENNDETQQRIDQFLRRDTDGSNPSNKREVAATELHDLLNSLLEAGSSYVNLKRDSAASRFLVRAKVAQFHPRDARRLRLIDFGRSLGD